MNKPRICEVLGVEVGERFNVYGNCLDWHVDEKGHVVSDDDKRCVDDVIYLAINHPDRIIRKPRWTEQEVERAKNLLEVERAKNLLEVVGPAELRKVADMVTMKVDGKIIYLRKDAFPSLKNEMAVTLDEIIGGAQ